MPDVTVKRVEEMDAVYDGMFVRARASLGVTSFGIQLENLPPNHEQYPEHDELGTGQEEVYIPIQGSARLIVGDAEYELVPGVFARVGPGEKRKILPGPDGLKLIAIGGVAGQKYVAPEWSELGSPPPGS